MKKVTRVMSLVMVLVLMLSAVSAQAQSYQRDKFSDVDEDHYANQYIELMSDLGIISGYGDGSFGPNDIVTREQFAKMMVLTLQLETKTDTGFFEDVSEKSWSYPYIEAARIYLTGYRSNNMNYYHPKENAVREDMAVAIVKGLGLSVEGVDLTVLDQFTDKSLISTNIRPYVAKAVIEGIMIGDGNKFSPLGSLKRAEAATLLARLITEEKVVYDDTKVVYDDTTSTTTKVATLKANVLSDKVYLDWTPVNASGFQYYKVVASATDSTPKYPGDGYVQAISSVTDTDTYIYPNDKVNLGDTEKLIPGKKYYVTITTVYSGDERYTSNVVEVVIPATSTTNLEKTPKLTYSVVDGGIKLSWTKTNTSNFHYYKVVLSKNDSTPAYPENGYLTYITDPNTITYKVVKDASYNSGDFGGEVDQGDTYYMSITAVYDDGKYTSNVIQVQIP